MLDFSTIGKLLLVVGALIAFIGLILIIAARFIDLGRLPGPITISSDGITIIFPIVGCIILSIVLTILLNVIVRLIR